MLSVAHKQFILQLIKFIKHLLRTYFASDIVQKRSGKLTARRNSVGLLKLSVTTKSRDFDNSHTQTTEKHVDF